MEFQSLIPSDGHLVYSTDPSDGSTQVFTPTMFHQLHCLDIIRRDYVARHASVGSERCLNYLRQTILCQSDLRLESARASVSPHLVSFSGDYTCNDWSIVYEAMRAHSSVT